MSKEIIPAELIDCINKLDADLTEENKNKIRNTPKDDLFILHFSLGLWIRNNFDLWQEGSPLVKFFNINGIIKADEMSTIIIKAYGCFFNGKKFNINDVAMD